MSGLENNDLPKGSADYISRLNKIKYLGLSGNMGRYPGRIL
jgi:hypothetical protein